jgi:hypothetical protein
MPRHRLVLITERKVNGVWEAHTEQQLAEFSSLNADGAIEQVRETRGRYEHNNHRRVATTSTSQFYFYHIQIHHFRQV